MRLKNMILLAGKILFLSLLYVLLLVAGSQLFPIHFDRPFSANPVEILMATLLMALVDTLMICWLIWRSRWQGWRLALAVSFAFYGVKSVMSQIETFYFAPALGIPPEFAFSILLEHLPVALILPAVAVWLLGKRRPETAQAAPVHHLDMPAGEWVWKMAVIAAAYLVLYFGFGFFVAWQNPNLVAMYGSGANQQVFNNAVLIPLQIVRSVLWVVFALPVMCMDKGSIWQTALLVGALYALPMNTGHLIPNPIMPDPSVRLSHFIETATSNFIFGLVVVNILLRKKMHDRSF